MAYSAFALCFFWILCCTNGGESNKDGMPQGINNVAVDFHSQRLRPNNTSVVDTSDVHSTWTWEPSGQEKNEIKSEPIVRLFNKGDWGSGADDNTYEEPEYQAEKEDIWIINGTIELTMNTTQRPKLTVDRRRNRTMEEAYLTHERRLRKTNWCFKDPEDTKLNKTKFKKTEECCRKHRECQASRHVKRGINECSCDIYFHICLVQARTKMAKSIQKMYFDRDIVCYRKDRKACADETCANVKYFWKIIPRHVK